MDSEKRTAAEVERRRLLRLAHQIVQGARVRLDEALRAEKVTAAQVRFLYEVGQRPGATGAQLARACHVTPQSAQAMMARAVGRGWVERGKDAGNERLVTARLTEAGERLIAFADQAMRGVEGKVWQGVTVEELRDVNGVLERGLERM